ncbi:hypothetical protein PG994_011843 [Apiospora phragmitis]|uniref:Uncharacterized protein n=1 Tax=Apiospora phragmitis TaxID=2905665 RepID=A0ABR1TU05_9PEZI
MSTGIKLTSKNHEAAHLMMQVRPLDWLRHGPIDLRDLQLINANPVPFVEYGKSSFVRKLLEWFVENNQEYMNIVAQMGANLVGFDPGAANGAVTGLDFTLENVRIFRGPRNTCPDHPWDAMILRDCTASTEGMVDKEEISSRKWDILP